MKKETLITPEEKITRWGEGEWVNEPDLIESAFLGHKYIVKRVFYIEKARDFLGNLCGYVVVPEGHPWYEKGWDDINASVHGGITFSQFVGDEYRVGFDCAHGGDLTPYEVLNYGKADQEETYKNIDYVTKQCESLIHQMIQQGLKK